MSFQGKTGKIKVLRVNDLGHVWGSPSEALHTEVTIMLDSDNKNAFGFEIKPGDDSLPSRLAMLTTLRYAYIYMLDVIISYERTEGVGNSTLKVVQLG